MQMESCFLAFMEACLGAVEGTGLSPREKLVYLCIRGRFAENGGESVLRKEICGATRIQSRHLSEVLLALEKKHLIVMSPFGIKPVLDEDTEAVATPSKDECASEVKPKVVQKADIRPKVKPTFVPMADIRPKIVEKADIRPNSGEGVKGPPHPLNNNKNKKNKSACARTYETSDAFLTFWERYPRKHDKFAVQEKWEELMAAGHEPVEIMAGLERAIVYWQKNYDGMAFIPYPLKWLNSGGWMDEENSPLVFEKQAAVASTGTRTVAAPVVYSTEEEAFLKAYGKKPRGAEDVELFHQAFQRALEEAGSSEVLCKAAQYAVEDCQYFEGSTQKMKRASYWLDDCDYRPWLNRARQAVGCNPQAKAPDLADTIIASMDFKR